MAVIETIELRGYMPVAIVKSLKGGACNVVYQVPLLGRRSEVLSIDRSHSIALLMALSHEPPGPEHSNAPQLLFAYVAMLYQHIEVWVVSGELDLTLYHSWLAVVVPPRDTSHLELSSYHTNNVTPGLSQHGDIVKVRAQGYRHLEYEVVDSGHTEYPINQPGFTAIVKLRVISTASRTPFPTVQKPLYYLMTMLALFEHTPPTAVISLITEGYIATGMLEGPQELSIFFALSLWLFENRLSFSKPTLFGKALKLSQSPLVRLALASDRLLAPGIKAVTNRMVIVFNTGPAL